MASVLLNHLQTVRNHALLSDTCCVHTLQSAVHLAESAGPWGSSRLQKSINLKSQIKNTITVAVCKNTTKITLQ